METPTRIFRPRFLPRDKYDARLSTAVTLLSLPVVGLIAALWFSLIPMWVFQTTKNAILTNLTFWILWLVWTSYFMLLPVRSVRVSAAGLEYWRGIRRYLIAWQDIDAVEEVSRGEMFRLTFDPRLLTGRFVSAASLTLADYVRIRHKNGVLLFPPEEKRAFLRALKRHCRTTTVMPVSVRSATPFATAFESDVFSEALKPVSHTAAPAEASSSHSPTTAAPRASSDSSATTIAPTAPSPSSGEARWYHTSYALREENKQRIHNQGS